MRLVLDWLGVSTFRLVVGETTIFLDAYIDRVPAAPPVGITTADVREADYVLGRALPLRPPLGRRAHRPADAVRS